MGFNSAFKGLIMAQKVQIAAENRYSPEMKKINLPSGL
jgi:hypothetical protein